MSSRIELPVVVMSPDPAARGSPGSASCIGGERDVAAPTVGESDGVAAHWEGKGGGGATTPLPPLATRETGRGRGRRLPWGREEEVGGAWGAVGGDNGGDGASFGEGGGWEGCSRR